MEVKFREASNVSKLTELHRAMQILAKIVNHPINSSGIFAAGLGLCIWHGLYWHCGIEIPQLVLCGQHPKSDCHSSSRVSEEVAHFALRKIVEKEIDRSNATVPGDDKIGSRVSWWFAGCARYPSNPSGIT